MVYLIVGVLVAVLIAVIVYQILRHLRGSLKIELPSTVFGSGELIAGRLTLSARKPIEGNRLFMALVGTEVTRRRHGDRTSTRTREIYRDEVEIDGVQSFPAGHTQTYEFEVAYPDLERPGFLDSTVGRTLTAAAEILGGSRSRLRWRLEARLDAKGIDLAASKRITVRV